MNPRGSALGVLYAMIDTMALGSSALAIAARSSTHGPAEVSLPLDIAVRTPSFVRPRRTRRVISQLIVCFATPFAVLMLGDWQSEVPPRPLGTFLAIELSLLPLRPGSRNTI